MRRLAWRRDLRLEALEPRRVLAANPIGEQFLVSEAFGLESGAPAVAILNDSGDFVAAWESYEEGADYLGYGVYAQRFLADGTPLDAEKILMNDANIDGDQLAPSVASDGMGNYLIAWQSKDQEAGGFDVYARWFASGILADAIPVNTSFTAGDQTHPDVAMDSDGNAVIVWQSEGQDGDGFGIYSKLYALGETNVGTDETGVNDTTEGNQTAPAVAMAVDNGQYVVTWAGEVLAAEAESNVEIFARRFDNSGSALDVTDVQVNTTTIRDQVTPDVASDMTGNFAVVWVSEGIPGSGSDVFGQRFNAAGVAQDDEFLVNVTTMASQVAPAVGMNGGGEYLVTWQSVHQDGFSWGIYGHEYNADGTDVVGKEEFRLNNYVMGPQTTSSVAVHPDGKVVVAWVGNDTDHKPAVHAKPYELPGVSTPENVPDLVLANFIALEDTPADAAMDAAGNSVAVWQSYGEDGDGLGIYAKRLDPTGEDRDVPGDAFLVNVGMELGNQSHPSIGGNASGQFVIAWQTDDLDAQGHDIYAQRFDVDGQRIGGLIAVNTTTVGDQADPAVGMAEDGSFIVVWTSPDEDGLGDPAGTGIFAQRFDGNGDPVAIEFQVNNERLRDQFSPTVAMNAAGQFVVGWVSDHPAVDNSETDPEKSVFVQWFDADGSFTGDEVIAHEYVKDAQEHPDVGIDAAGNFVVTWQSINQEGMMGASWGVYGRQFDATKTPLTPTEFHVNELTSGPQRYSTVGVDAEGRFVISWQSNAHEQDGTSWELLLRQYDAAGTALRGEEVVNTWSSGPQINPVVARSEEGNFGIFWTGQGAAHTEGVHGRLYDVNLPDQISLETRLPIAEQFLTAETFALEGSPPDVAVDATGAFITTWESFEQDGSGWSVYAQRYDAGGNPLDLAFPVNTFVTGDQHAPVVASDDFGNALIVWQSNGQDGEGYGIYGQWYDSTGAAVGDEFLVNTATTAGDQAAPDVAMISVDLGLAAVVTWQSADSDGTGIMAKWYDYPVVTEVLFGTPTAGDELLVNTNEIGDQTAPTVALASASGQLVIAWQGPAIVAEPVEGEEEASLEIFAQMYASVGAPKLPGFVADGSELLVNSILTHDQVTPAVAMDADGMFVVAFVSEGQTASGSDVYARRLDNTGAGLGADFLVNTEILRPQRSPAVGMNADGDFMISWQSSFQEPDPFSWGIFAHTYDAAGNTLEGEFLVNTLTSGPQTNVAVGMNGTGDTVAAWVGLDASHLPAVHGKLYTVRSDTPIDTEASELILSNYMSPEESPPAAGMDADGNSLVVWQSYNEDGSGLGVFGQRIDPIGQRVGTPFLVNTGFTAGNQSEPDMAMNADGHSVVVWQSEDQDGSGYGIYAQRYDRDRLPLGAAITVNTVTGGDQTLPSVGIATDGAFVVTWQSPDDDGLGIFARRFASDGEAVDLVEFQVNEEVDLDQFGSSVSMNPSGQFVVAWVSDHPAAVPESEDTEKSVFVQWFDSDGSTDGQPEVLVHEFVKDAQEFPDVGMDATGNFVVVWQSINQDGNTWGVLARQFDTDKNPLQVREFVVNTTRLGPQRFASVGVAESGQFVVAWQSISYQQEGSSWDIYCQQYSPDATREGPELAVNTWNQGPQIHPVVAQAPDGEYAVYWVGAGTDHSEGVHGRIYRFPDYGDAPDSYGTTLTSTPNAGARHAFAANGLILGELRDREPDGLPTADATGDDATELDDGDGVYFITPLAPGASATLAVLASGTGMLNAWVDFGADGSFAEVGDQIFIDEAVTAGYNVLSFAVPATAVLDDGALARFRLNGVGGLSFDGTADDGEVEDYLIQDPTSHLCIVNSTLDTGDALPGDGICGDGSGTVTLRAAIEEFNALANLSEPDLILFNIPGAGLQTITPSTALPTITEAVVIDGTTQPDFVVGAPVIELNGSLAGIGVNGLSITLGGSTVRGLVINRFTGSGIELFGAGGNTIAGNFIGTDATGTTDLGNTQHGVHVSSSAANTIGGTTDAARNVISGNDQFGVFIEHTLATGNLVQGNFIGTDAAGTADLGNSRSGVLISAASANMIGGASVATRNVISGNNQHGVHLLGSGGTGNTVQGNFIGLDASGTAPLGNRLSGVFVRSPANTIGGAAMDAGNVISGNHQDGVRIIGSLAAGNIVHGNSIGTDFTGMSDLGNTLSGVVINGAANNTIGGTSIADRNVISGNNQFGVYLANAGATGNKVQGNFIGTNRAGTAALGNSRSGVFISDSSSNTVGGTSPGAGNVISGNTQHGVHLLGIGGTGNTVQGNLIGTDAGGAAPVANTLNGVFVRSPSNTIGGAAMGADNTIAFNGQAGVYVVGNPATKNAIRQNSTFANAGLGIDLAAVGLTPNDTMDPDTGSNNVQNFPDISSVVLNSGNLDINLLVDSTVTHSAYDLIVEFFIADAASQEGHTFLGSSLYHAASAGNSVLVSVPAGTAGIGTDIVATATDANGNTSEFSAPVTVAAALWAADGESSGGAPISTAELAPVVDAAIQRFVLAGFDGGRLSSIDVSLANLPSATLGLATVHSIRLDADAAGHGWYVDLTPLDDSEFNQTTAHPRALSSSQRIDLLTAVMHELGHVLGLVDLEPSSHGEDIMSATLATGVRRTSYAADVDAILANYAGTD